MLITSALLVAGGAAALGWWARRRRVEGAGEVSVGEVSVGEAAVGEAAVGEAAVGEAAVGGTAAVDVDAAIGGDDARFPVYLGASVAAVALGTAARVVYPPLAVLSIPPFLVAVVPFFKRLYAGARAGSHRGVAFIEFASMTGTLALGQVYLSQVCAALVLGSQWLLKQTEDRSRRRLFDVYEALPETAIVERDGVVFEVALDAVARGDVVHLEAGRIAPVDGVVLSGRVEMDERALTGEARPVARGAGEAVLASTLVVEGHARVRVERSGRESIAAEVVGVLNRTTDYRTEVRSRGQQIVEAGAGPTIALSGLALVALGPVPAVAVLFAAFGYNMRYAGPIAVLTCLERTSREGILVKDGRALELLAMVDVVVFDKTGTLTADALVVEAVHVVGAGDEGALLAVAAACERYQRHPIAQAVVAEAEGRGVVVPEAVDVAVEVGLGVRARVDGEAVVIGSERLMQGVGVALPEAMGALVAACDARGASVVFVARGGALMGTVVLSARARPEAAGVVRALQARGVEVCVLSGDRVGPTRALAAELGIERFFAEVLPQEKARIVGELQAGGRSVCFVGDGINDVIALRQADVSVSLAGASTIATDAAPIVLMSGDLVQLPQAFALADELVGNLRSSVALSVAPGMVCVGGIFVGAIGLGGAVVWYNASLLASVVNALRPLLALPGRSSEASVSSVSSVAAQGARSERVGA